MNLGTAHVIRANARHLPLADNSVDLIVTSPPYFALRSYQDGGEHYDGQIGDEPTPAEFVDSLIEVTAECMRVLKPSGSLWVNLGDKYASGGGLKAQTFAGDPAATLTTSRAGKRTSRQLGVAEKSLIGIPWRYALRCIDDLGLILRAEVIWSKPNGLPESVTDRVRRSHETWFHFTLQPRYFSAVDEIREPHGQRTIDDRKGNRRLITGAGAAVDRTGNEDRRAIPLNPLGKLPGSVWTVPTEPLRVPDHLGVDHFAAFPTEWPKRIIQGWSPAGVCVECGEGRRPVVERDRRILTGNFGSDMAGHGQDGRDGRRAETTAAIRGYACACAPRCEHDYGPGDHHFESGYCPPLPMPPVRPAVVLDPFGGTGTTAMVAKALGRTGISVDMSADYCRLAEWRTNDRDQLAKVLGVAKTEQQPDDQGDLLDLISKEPA